MSPDTLIVIFGLLTIGANLATLYFIRRTKRALAELERNIEAAMWEEVPVPDVAGWPEQPTVTNVPGTTTR